MAFLSNQRDPFPSGRICRKETNRIVSMTCCTESSGKMPPAMSIPLCSPNYSPGARTCGIWWMDCCMLSCPNAVCYAHRRYKKLYSGVNYLSCQKLMVVHPIYFSLIQARSHTISREHVSIARPITERDNIFNCKDATPEYIDMGSSLQPTLYLTCPVCRVQVIRIIWPKIHGSIFFKRETPAGVHHTIMPVLDLCHFRVIRQNQYIFQTVRIRQSPARLASLLIWRRLMARLTILSKRPRLFLPRRNHWRLLLLLLFIGNHTVPIVPFLLLPYFKARPTAFRRGASRFRTIASTTLSFARGATILAAVTADAVQR
jgi:hypothetical protein